MRMKFENTHTTKLQPIQHYYLEEFNKPANNININMHKKSKKRSLMKINLGFINILQLLFLHLSKRNFKHLHIKLILLLIFSSYSIISSNTSFTNKCRSLTKIVVDAFVLPIVSSLSLFLTQMYVTHYRFGE